MVLVVLISGLILFSLITLISLFNTGLAIGITLFTSVQYMGLQKTLLLFVPHAIFELPALWIAGAAGFKIPHELIQYLHGKKDYIVNKQELKEFAYLALISFVLIVIAAWIEANVTMKIAEGMT